MKTADRIATLEAEIMRLREEVAALRLTAGGVHYHYHTLPSAPVYVPAYPYPQYPWVTTSGGIHGAVYMPKVS